MKITGSVLKFVPERNAELVIQFLDDGSLYGWWNKPLLWTRRPGVGPDTQSVSIYTFMLEQYLSTYAPFDVAYGKVPDHVQVLIRN